MDSPMGLLPVAILTPDVVKQEPLSDAFVSCAIAWLRQLVLLQFEALGCSQPKCPGLLVLSAFHRINFRKFALTKLGSLGSRLVTSLCVACRSESPDCSYGLHI